MSKQLRRFSLLAAGLVLTVALIAAALAAVAWQALAARDGEWSQRVRFTLAGRTFERELGTATLLRAATHPLAARLVNGLALPTAHGRVHLAARADGAIAARCQPCAWQVAALGPQPVQVERAELVLRADGADRYHGTLTLGVAPRTLTLAGHAAFDRAGQLTIEAALPPTPMADAVHVLGRDLPERDSVQVKGTLALTLKVKAPHGAWRITPRLDGFHVAGLATERLADLQRPAACRVDAQAGVGAIGGWLPRAVIAAEDSRFYEHPGYDLQALTDALQHNQQPGAAIAGASTLTQQLAKLVVAGDERSATRKLRELLYAVEMERTLGKARILQLYLALAPWGDGVCGAERAVRVHLGQRDAASVGPVAAAWIASLLPSPNAYLQAEHAAGEIDHARVGRVLASMRPMSPERREKALLSMLFWAPPALARLREAPVAVAAQETAPLQTPPLQTPLQETPSQETPLQETPPVAPLP
jgi:Transglycosylase